MEGNKCPDDYSPEDLIQIQKLEDEAYVWIKKERQGKDKRTNNVSIRIQYIMCKVYNDRKSFYFICI